MTRFEHKDTFNLLSGGFKSEIKNDNFINTCLEICDCLYCKSRREGISELNEEPAYLSSASVFRKVYLDKEVIIGRNPEIFKAIDEIDLEKFIAILKDGYDVTCNNHELIRYINKIDNSVLKDYFKEEVEIWYRVNGETYNDNQNKKQ